MPSPDFASRVTSQFCILPTCDNFDFPPPPLAPSLGVVPSLGGVTPLISLCVVGGESEVYLRDTMLPSFSASCLSARISCTKTNNMHYSYQLSNNAQLQRCINKRFTILLTVYCDAI